MFQILRQLLCNIVIIPNYSDIPKMNPGESRSEPQPLQETKNTKETTFETTYINMKIKLKQYYEQE